MLGENIPFRLSHSLTTSGTLPTIFVADVPSEPKGPLKAADITKDGCVLHWRPPEDDGGQSL